MKNFRSELPSELPFELLQIFDSSFPSSSFAHSFGLENAIEGSEGDLTLDTLRSWISEYIEFGLVRGDLSVLLRAYSRLQESQRESISCREALLSEEFVSLSQILVAQRGAEEYRKAIEQISNSTLRVLLLLWPTQSLTLYAESCRREDVTPSAPVALAILCDGRGWSIQDILRAYLFASVKSLILNAQRAISFGHIRTQSILVDLYPVLEQALDRVRHLPSLLMLTSSVYLESCSMNHRYQSQRLFLS